MQGFLEEIFFKYDHMASFCHKLYNAFECCFELLPIAALINSTVCAAFASVHVCVHEASVATLPYCFVQVLVLHGGLFRHDDVTIADLDAIKVCAAVLCVCLPWSSCGDYYLRARVAAHAPNSVGPRHERV